MAFQSSEERIWMENEDGRVIAEIDFPQVKPGVVNIAHTFVDSSLRGQGIADKITRAAADQLRSEDRKAVLSCSYAIRWFGEHPEYSDILEDPEREAKTAGALAGPACGIRKA